MSREFEPYAALSAIYDSVSNVAAKKAAVLHLMQALHRERNKGPRILDLASGTGNVSLLLVAEGAQVIGVDCSQAMLRAAQEKLAPWSDRVELLNQDMRDLRLSKCCDGAICLSFSLCYLTEDSEFLTVIDRLANALPKDGLFLFDILNASAPDSGWITEESARWAKHGIGWQFSWLDRGRLKYCIRYHLPSDNMAAMQEQTKEEVHVGRAYTSRELHELFDMQGSFVLEDLPSLRTPSLDYFMARRI